MPLFRVKFPTEHHFTVSVFGCQYHADSPSDQKLTLIDSFEKLIKPAAIHVDEFEQNDLPTKIWMSYWATPQDFKAWWESPDVTSFWESLPEDAGFWRETVSLPATRAMHQAVFGDRQDGFGYCGNLVPLTERMGYWGAYRSRLTKDPPDEKFASPLSAVPEPKPLSDKVRAGRFVMTKFPDNLCFVVEGQDYSSMGEREREHWNENLDQSAKRWVSNVMMGGAEKGLVNARACHGFAGGKLLGATQDTGIFPGLDYVRQAQILFWLDLSYMEHMGKHDPTHVKLRGNFVKSYGPGGEMEGGDLLLWVDLGVLRADEVDAEYVGCFEGTGFLAFDHHPSFGSERVVTAKLPAFFEKPIASNPEDW